MPRREGGNSFIALPNTRQTSEHESSIYGDSELTLADFEGLEEFPKALLSSVLELLAERKVNHPGTALTLSPDDLASSWDLVAQPAALPDPPGHPDAREDAASAYWYERSLADLLSRGFLLEVEENTFRVPELDSLLRLRDTY